jgi:hypothetical protein
MVADVDGFQAMDEIMVSRYRVSHPNPDTVLINVICGTFGGVSTPSGRDLILIGRYPRSWRSEK